MWVPYDGVAEVVTAIRLPQVDGRIGPVGDPSPEKDWLKPARGLYRESVHSLPLDHPGVADHPSPGRLLLWMAAGQKVTLLGGALFGIVFVMITDSQAWSGMLKTLFG